MTPAHNRAISLLFCLPLIAFDGLIIRLTYPGFPHTIGIVAILLSLPMFAAALRLSKHADATWVRRLSIIFMLVIAAFITSIMLMPVDVLCSDAMPESNCMQNAHNIPWTLVISFVVYAVCYGATRRTRS